MLFSEILEKDSFRLSNCRIHLFTLPVGYHPFVCQSVDLSTCLAVNLFLFMFMYNGISACLFVCLSVYPPKSVFLSIYLNTCLSYYKYSVCLSACLSVYLSVCLSICLFVPLINSIMNSTNIIQLNRTRHRNTSQKSINFSGRVILEISTKSTSRTLTNVKRPNQISLTT